MGSIGEIQLDSQLENESIADESNVSSDDDPLIAREDIVSEVDMRSSFIMSSNIFKT